MAFNSILIYMDGMVRYHVDSDPQGGGEVVDEGKRGALSSSAI